MSEHEPVDGAFVRASDLAQLGACERRVRFDSLHGRRSTRAQRLSSARGVAEHQRFCREGEAIVAASATKGRCFIATLSLGSSEETRALRAYRDLVLRRRWWGRRFIGLYYAASPGLVALIRRSPAAVRLAAALLRPLARAARRAVQRRLLP